MSLYWSAISGLTNYFTMWHVDTELAGRHWNGPDSATSPSIHKMSLLHCFVFLCHTSDSAPLLRSLPVPPASDRLIDQYSVRVEWPYSVRPTGELNRTSPCWERKVLLRHYAASSWQELDGAQSTADTCSYLSCAPSKCSQWAEDPLQTFTLENMRHGAGSVFTNWRL